MRHVGGVVSWTEDRYNDIILLEADPRSTLDSQAFETSLSNKGFAYAESLDQGAAASELGAD
jgi:hypothetical protein